MFSLLLAVNLAFIFLGGYLIIQNFGVQFSLSVPHTLALLPTTPTFSTFSTFDTFTTRPSITSAYIATILPTPLPTNISPKSSLVIPTFLPTPIALPFTKIDYEYIHRKRKTRYVCPTSLCRRRVTFVVQPPNEVFFPAEVLDAVLPLPGAVVIASGPPPSKSIAFRRRFQSEPRNEKVESMICLAFMLFTLLAIRKSLILIP
jgi:hypothetical protein